MSIGLSPALTHEPLPVRPVCLRAPGRTARRAAQAVGLAVGLGGTLTTRAPACDLCSVYTAPPARVQSGQGIFAGVAEQYTHLGTLQQDGHETANEAGQYLDSSISQVFGGYAFSDRLGVQFNLPVLYRSFKRPEGFAIDQGTESGIGDASLLGRFCFYHREANDSQLDLALLGGVKFPTGDTSRLAEELNESTVPGAPASAIHGHDLTLGSGSFDGLVGLSVFARSDPVFLSAQAQYAVRSIGDFDYRFANDFLWSAGPGVFLARKANYTLSLQANASGETKGSDTLAGVETGDTAITSFFVGPLVAFTWSDRLSAEAAADLPVHIDNTGLQAVPDYRVRAGITWRF